MLSRIFRCLRLPWKNRFDVSYIYSLRSFILYFSCISAFVNFLFAFGIRLSFSFWVICSFFICEAIMLLLWLLWELRTLVLVLLLLCITVVYFFRRERFFGLWGDIACLLFFALYFLVLIYVCWNLVCDLGTFPDTWLLFLVLLLCCSFVFLELFFSLF